MKKFLDVITENDARGYRAWSRLARWSRHTALAVALLAFGMMIAGGRTAWLLALPVLGGCHLLTWYAFEQMKLHTKGLERATAALEECTERTERILHDG